MASERGALMLQARFQLPLQSFMLDAELRVPARGVTAVFGRSGSGKTTLLRCIAGLERHARGFLQLDTKVWQDDSADIFVAAHRRPFGFVFQDGRLFPHLRVADNLDYGQRRAGGIDRDHRNTVVDLLGLGRLLQHYPHQLSGGEQQRVAIGRALLTRPQLLLMDEPLASLDLQRKNEILPYLDGLHSALDIPLLYVSHSPDEVLRLADYLVLLDGGRVEAQGPLHALLARLDLPFSHSNEAAAVIPATVSSHDQRHQLTELVFDGGSLRVAHAGIPLGQQVRVLIHARDVSLALTRAEDSSILNILEATVLGHETRGGQVTVSVQVGGAVLLARITALSSERLGIRPGLRLFVQIKSIALSG